MKMLPLLACLAVAAPLHALEWPATAATIRVPAGQKQVRCSFRFRNSEDHAVRIVSVETSCHCTEASASISVVPSKAAGQIDVIYTVGEQTGHQEKHVYVQTDESDQPQALDLSFDIGK